MAPVPKSATPTRISERHARRLQHLLTSIIPSNQFYTSKLSSCGVNVQSVRTVSDLRELPFTTKAELISDQERNSPYGSALTYPVSSYSRLHQTSGTSSQPLRWLDTAESWDWMLGCWDAFYEIVGLKPDDRLFFAFSFGPFLGFWTAFEAAARSHHAPRDEDHHAERDDYGQVGARRGHFCIPAGGLSSTARLRLMCKLEATVVLCTPTYALRMAEVAAKDGIDLAASPVRALIVAGEPGGSIPATRQRIEAAWGARLFDHNGLTEVGPVGVECTENPNGLHILESEYIAEVIDPATTAPASPGEIGELVLTNLGRIGSAVIRYRTGDLVCVDPEPCPCGREFMRLKGGIIGRTDDMIHLRGNNLYPSALEAIIRRFAEVAEYRITVDETNSLSELQIEIEPVGVAGDVAERIAHRIRDELLFRADVASVPPGSLPRFEMKAKRIHHRRTKVTEQGQREKEI